MGQFSLTNNAAWFKEKYGKVSENTYNGKNVIQARVKKSYKFTGKFLVEAIPTSFNGGVGSGSLPVPNTDTAADAIIRAKKVYSTVKIDREAIKAADGEDGSFIKQTGHTVKKGVESFMRNCSRILFNSLDNGELGRGDNSTAVTGLGTTADPYLVIIALAQWKEANWEEQDGVNVGVETTVLTVLEVVPSTRQIKLVGTSAILAAAVAAVGATNAKIYMQGSKDNDPTSIATALSATSSTLYGVTVSRRWQAPVQADSNGAGVTTDMLNEDILGVERRSGQLPNLIVAGYTQYIKILNLLEDKKEYVIDARAENLKGKISFKGIEYMSPAGPIPIIYERFVENDRLYYLNDNFVDVRHRPDFGWFDDDGTVFLRSNDEDSYEARYGGYYENYIPPTFHGYRHDLAT